MALEPCLEASGLGANVAIFDGLGVFAAEEGIIVSGAGFVFSISDEEG